MSCVHHLGLKSQEARLHRDRWPAPFEQVGKAPQGCESPPYSGTKLNCSHRGVSVRISVLASPPRAGTLALSVLRGLPFRLSLPLNHVPSSSGQILRDGCPGSLPSSQNQQNHRGLDTQMQVCCPLPTTVDTGNQVSVPTNRPPSVGAPQRAPHELRRNSRRKAPTTSCFQ